jgi:hypothetical protein
MEMAPAIAHLSALQLRVHLLNVRRLHVEHVAELLQQNSRKLCANGKSSAQHEAQARPQHSSCVEVKRRCKGLAVLAKSCAHEKSFGAAICRRPDQQKKRKSAAA